MPADSNAPRHRRHAAPQPEAASAPASRAQAPRQEAEGVVAAAPEVLSDIIPEVMPIADGDQEISSGSAPRPIGVDPSETGSFARIAASEGARVTTRANASETASFRMENARPVEAVRMSTAGRPKVERREKAVKSNARVFVALGVAALLVVGIVGFLVARALTSVEEVPAEQVVEQVQASEEQSIEYRGTTYAITQQDSGTYAFTSSSEDQEGTSVVFELKGTPVTLILHDMVFVIPENQSDGTWDLVAHAMGSGSVTQLVTDGEGNPVRGEGEIVEATLVGAAVEIVTAAGERQSISLV